MEKLIAKVLIGENFINYISIFSVVGSKDPLKNS